MDAIRTPATVGKHADLLNAMLRVELTAVHQQFIHILALRVWKEDAIAERIAEVDRVDFPVAMRVLDTMVSRGVDPNPGPASFAPGANPMEMLLAEQSMERQLLPAISAVRSANVGGEAIADAAMAPRAAYADWLAGRLSEIAASAGPRIRPATQISPVFDQAIVMIEEALAHAFVHWHRGEAKDADAAWATSGAAMVFLTALTQAEAARGGIPVPGEVPAPRISFDPETALARERERARLCAERAGEAAEIGEDKEIALVCREFAEFAAKLSDWSPGQPHPASGSNPAAFKSFQRVLRLYVWPTAPATIEGTT